MDENRINDKLDRIAEDCAATRARVDNLYQYVGAVSDNQKKTEEKLDVHMLDSNYAHGLDGGRRWTDVLFKAGTFALAAIGFLLGIKKEH